MMTVKWVLLLVTAINRTEFDSKPIGHIREKLRVEAEAQ